MSDYEMLMLILTILSMIVKLLLIIIDKSLKTKK